MRTARTDCPKAPGFGVLCRVGAGDAFISHLRTGSLGNKGTKFSPDLSEVADWFLLSTVKGRNIPVAYLPVPALQTSS